MTCEAWHGMHSVTTESVLCVGQIERGGGCCEGKKRSQSGEREGGWEGGRKRGGWEGVKKGKREGIEGRREEKSQP